MIRIAARTVVFTVLSIGIAAHGAMAGEMPLPWSLEWGNSREKCTEALTGAGYSRYVDPSEYSASRAAERRVRVIREAQGISRLEFARIGSDGPNTENVTVLLHNDRLFQITISYGNTKRDFADKLIRDISERMASGPRQLMGKDSAMENYIWASFDTVIIFTCGYGKSMPTSIAVLDYRNERHLRGLREIGLM